MAKKDVLAHQDKRVSKRKILIEKGEIVEFRFNSPKHFRTMEDKYFYVSEEEWEENFIEIANIHSDVVWKNIAKLEEIWRLQLFDWIPQGKELYEKMNKELETSESN